MLTVPPDTVTFTLNERIEKRAHLPTPEELAKEERQRKKRERESRLGIWSFNQERAYPEYLSARASAIAGDDFKRGRLRPGRVTRYAANRGGEEREPPSVSFDTTSLNTGGARRAHMRERLVATVGLGVAILLATSIPVSADCSPRDFMIQDVESIEQRGETELAFVLTATQQEFDSAKKSGSLGGAYKLISGSANFQEAKERARMIAQATKFDFKHSYASNYFAQSLSEKARDAYVACLEKDKERPGLKLWFEEANGDYLTFSAFWVGRDTGIAVADYDTDPLIDGGSIVSHPTTWVKGKTEQVVVKRSGNSDLFLNLKVGGQVASIVVVKEPPAVTWRSKQVVSPKLIRTNSHGPNPGCTAGRVTDCIYPTMPGGYLVPKTATMTEGSTTDPRHYSQSFYIDTPEKVCVEMTQGTGACQTTHRAHGRLEALEKYPQAVE